MTLVIGLTGGIATGKTTVSQYLIQRGLPVIDADQVAREVVEPGTSGLRQITATFGATIIMPSGELDRSALGKLVFSSPVQRHRLDEIMQPLIRERIEQCLREYRRRRVPLVVLDAPLLIEQHYQNLCDYLMVVVTDPQAQLARLMKRNHLTEEQARQRIASQLPLKEKIAQADVVINNNGLLEKTLRQVDEWLATVENR